MSTSQADTAAVASIAVTVSLIYIIGLYFLYRYSQRHPKALNSAQGVRVQKYTPFVYVFLIFCSIVEIAVAVWLMVQYRNAGWYPSLGARNGICLCLFSGCWTLVFSTIYVVLIVHPTLSKNPAVSIGGQSLWVLATWSFWVACVATVNGALPLATSGVCWGIAFCSQTQALFAFAIIEMVTFTLCMLVLGYLLYTRARQTMKTPLAR
ncbi:hypothetical protein WOLCODRAFT_101576 [Wolfiporia cocos MD-104 SS10]|uniref:MARVEL domain-containing protein n=1 Tax=Wolfiporia cocos (strain MD-104) TaxID=742152 RepID=A0A2H3JKR9_WOLCO|nr:hypothetical protein WOLCODRAFT_101576 [Wolfiporia cocos MD-104 SS10]